MSVSKLTEEEVTDSTTKRHEEMWKQAKVDKLPAKDVVHQNYDDIKRSNNIHDLLNKMPNIDSRTSYWITCIIRDVRTCDMCLNSENIDPSVERLVLSYFSMFIGYVLQVKFPERKPRGFWRKPGFNKKQLEKYKQQLKRLKQCGDRYSQLIPLTQTQIGLDDSPQLSYDKTSSPARMVSVYELTGMEITHLTTERHEKLWKQAKVDKLPAKDNVHQNYDIIRDSNNIHELLELLNKMPNVDLDTSHWITCIIGDVRTCDICLKFKNIAPTAEKLVADYFGEFIGYVLQIKFPERKSSRWRSEPDFDKEQLEKYKQRLKGLVRRGKFYSEIIPLTQMHFEANKAKLWDERKKWGRLEEGDIVQTP
jgi:hypothetical protein